MNAGPFSERVYGDLRDLVTSRETQPGARLDPSVIAKQLNSSTTPVREALNRLVGERIVETRTSTGYHLPLIDEPALKDLIGWSNDILSLALRRITSSLAPAAELPGPSSNYPDRIAATFAAIVKASRHVEYIPAIAQANARLHAVRLGEHESFDDLDDELSGLEKAIRNDQVREVRKLVQSYHRRRQKAAAELLRRRYRAG
ncbi:regulatory GntR family protein [Novosphingobium sp. PhB57]|uniref:GntR family transcriptional regulator n=1 Tax=Novosphingobium sp. PhB57 TaxID=2485107 RepID=UPI001046CFF8|nr:GntR family transcriptional regulator [Novosphingobium sp. PhB57]TCU51836.1 regulatory GntR family protein [Novosphingobium sp. PhB57]